MSVASIALVFAQFDLIMIRLVVDLLVNQYTIRRFLINKTHDPFRYHNEFRNESESDDLVVNVDDYVPRECRNLAKSVELTDIQISSPVQLHVHKESAVETLEPGAKFVIEDSDNSIGGGGHLVRPKKTKQRSSGTI